MKNRLLTAGILAFVLAWGMMVVGCDIGDDTTGDNDKNAQDGENANEEIGNEENAGLPDPVGANELSGKEYDSGLWIISFDADNAYTITRKNWEETNEDKIFETGFYSWDTSQKTVFLALDKQLGGEEPRLMDKAETRARYIESYSDEQDEQYVDRLIERDFSVVTYDYTIEDNEIAYFGIKVKLSDTGSAIANLAYSQKAPTEGFGVHYLLSNTTFDDALTALSEAYGHQPTVDDTEVDDLSLAEGASWIIVEFTRYNDMILAQKESDTVTTKGWFFP